MPAKVDTTHPSYDCCAPMWDKCRDALAGEDAVKLKGATYLPKLDGQEASEYDAYRMRALFYGATERTVTGLSGAIVRKQATMKLPSIVEDELPEIGCGSESFEQITKDVLNEVLGLGRIGVLVDAENVENGEVYLTTFCAEKVINWRTGIVRGREQLILVVLREDVERPNAENRFKTDIISQIRVLELIDFENKPKYVVSRFVKGEKDKEYKQEGETIIPSIKGGKTFDMIPFCFISPKGLGAEPLKSPVLDLVNVNLSHYRTYADLEHGRHYTALPTPWAAGFATDTELRLGSSRAWVTDVPTASAGFLEFTGQGLASLSTALEEKEKQMATLGARLLEEQPSHVEAAATVRLRQSGEQSVLGSVASACSQGLTQALKWYTLWVTGKEDDSILVELNSDFGSNLVDAATLSGLMASVQGGLISWDTFFFNLKRGEFVPDGRTEDEERKLIEMGLPDGPATEPPEVPEVPENVPPDDDPAPYVPTPPKAGSGAQGAS